VGDSTRNARSTPEARRESALVLAQASIPQVRSLPKRTLVVAEGFFENEVAQPPAFEDDGSAFLQFVGDGEIRQSLGCPVFRGIRLEPQPDEADPWSLLIGGVFEIWPHAPRNPFGLSGAGIGGAERSRVIPPDLASMSRTDPAGPLCDESTCARHRKRMSVGSEPLEVGLPCGGSLRSGQPGGFALPALEIRICRRFKRLRSAEPTVADCKLLERCS